MARHWRPIWVDTRHDEVVEVTPVEEAHHVDALVQKPADFGIDPNDRVLVQAKTLQRSDLLKYRPIYVLVYKKGWARVSVENDGAGLAIEGWTFAMLHGAIQVMMMHGYRRPEIVYFDVLSTRKSGQLVGEFLSGFIEDGDTGFLAHPELYRSKVGVSNIMTDGA